MIEPARAQLSLAEGLIEEEVGPLWEDWMREVDQLLADRALVQIVYEVLARRWPNSRTRGRPGTPADVVLRLLLLKHMRNWSIGDNRRPSGQYLPIDMLKWPPKSCRCATPSVR